MRCNLVYSTAREVGRSVYGAIVLAVAAAWLVPSMALAADISVDCSNPRGRVKTITAALARLDKTAENTIHVSGACNEWVHIWGFENLTLLGNSGASINAPTTPPADGYYIVFNPLDSGSVIVKGFTINGVNGEPTGVQCHRVRYCDFENTTIQGAGVGLIASGSTNLYLNGDTIQDNAGTGVGIGWGATHQVNALIYGGTVIQRNGQGIRVNASSLTLWNNGSPDLPVTIQDNDGPAGVIASDNSTVHIEDNSVRIGPNRNVGISLTDGSVARIGQYNTISGGPGGAVQIGSLSMARFGENIDLSGGPPVVNCVGTYSVAVGLLAGISTNCPQ
jgi:hypothetical protein